MADLIAWLDAQERKTFSRVAPTDEIVEAFDPLLNRLGLEIHDRGEQGMEGRGARMRRTRKWHFEQDFAKSLVLQMMNKIKQAVQTRHKINYRNAFELRNIENGEHTVYYTNTNSPWLDRLLKTKAWLTT